MKKLCVVLLAASAAFAGSTAASAADLLNITNTPAGSTSYSLGFTAGSANTAVTFGGYDVNSFSNVFDINLHQQGNTTNLLGASFAYTPAACGALADQPGIGLFGTNNLSFGGVCNGSYDRFSQTFASITGTAYVLDFVYQSSGSELTGLVVQVSDARVSSVPEPTTWMTLLLGLGAVGFALRRRSREASATA